MPTYMAPSDLRLSLDFLQRMRQRNKTYVFLDANDVSTLDGILSDGITYDPGTSVQLERRAHAFLVKLQDMDPNEGFLDIASDRKEETERRELAALINPMVASPDRVRTRSTRKIGATRTTRQWVGIGVGSVVSVIALAIAAPAINGVLHQAGPPNGTAQQNPPAQTVPASPTDLQNLKQDFGPWKQLTPSDQQPQTGSPAFALLENGGFYVSTTWTIPAHSSAWSQDIGGNIENVDVKGNFADITDADGNPYIVGIDQAFIVSSNPQTVLKIDPTGTVYSTTLAQATAVRQHLSS